MSDRMRPPSRPASWDGGRSEANPAKAEMIDEIKASA
jgi:hypothetical protein